MRRILFAALALLVIGPVAQAADTIYPLHDGVTAFVPNPEGKKFSLTVGVRDINVYETGPREVLVKVYDPDGKALVREIIPDDGVTTQAYSQPAGAFGHEAWYLSYNRLQGLEPMLRWTAFSEPDRLATIPERTFTYSVPATKPGVYRIMLVGSVDHYVRLSIDPAMPYAVAGHPHFVRGRGDMYRRSYVYVPRGALGLQMLLLEHDTPRTRRYKVSTPDGKVLCEGDTSTVLVQQLTPFEQPGQFDEQLLTVEVTAGPGDFLLGVMLRMPKDPEVTQRGQPCVAGVLAPTPELAKAVQGGAIYHDGRVFWQAYQVRFHEWLKKLQPADFVVKDAEGKEIAPDKLTQHPNFYPLNANHWRSPLSDTIMHHYQTHKNPQALNLALRDLAAGLRSIGPHDHPAVAVSGAYANMAYEFGAYAWHYWRPAWRVLQHSDAPNEVKEIVRDAMLVCGDRLAFCRSWERVNGNSFALIPLALRYCYAGTDDDLQKKLFEVYWDRFTTGGWGDRVGIGPSGPVQEGFAYAYHYASYITHTWKSVNADFQDPRFINAHGRIVNWFSYTLSDERIAAGPWSSRTHHYPQTSIQTEGPYAWKGLPGPDFTDNVNGGSEWFAARRQNYYVLTYHGRLSPVWNPGRGGYGGGMLCQLQVPDKGPVLVSTLNGEYGHDMHPHEWRNFHIHGIVGTTANGRPLIGPHCEHLNAKLDGTTVTGSGPIRESAVQSTRSYTFGADDITCSVELKETEYHGILNLFTKDPLPGIVTEAYEMIPYVGYKLGGKATPKKPASPTDVIALAADGATIGPVTKEPVSAKAVVIDRGGFGARVEFEEPRSVLLGENNTLLVQVATAKVSANEIALKYRIVPFVKE